MGHIEKSFDNLLEISVILGMVVLFGGLIIKGHFYVAVR